MKIVWICILLLVSSSAICQERNFNIPDSVLKKFLTDTLFFSQLSNNQPSPKSWTRRGITNYGDVYSLPLDNMPCIVPVENSSQRMPNFGKMSGFNIDPGIYFVPGMEFKHLYWEKLYNRPNEWKLIPKKKSLPLK